MSFTSSDFTGVRLRRLVRFCRRVNAIKQTPDLIRLVARETEYFGFCRKITDPERKFQTQFAAMCRTNLIDPDDICKRMKVVASVFRVYNEVDYYQVLGVPLDADVQAIKQAYRKKALILHPDKAAGDDKDGVKFAELNDAYVHLSDPQMRYFYDQTRIGADCWIEGNESKQRFAVDVCVGRLLSRMLILVGIIVIVAYAFYPYQDERLTLFAENSPSDRSDRRYAVPAPTPDESAARDALTAPQSDDVEMGVLRKRFPVVPTLLSVEPSEEPAETDDAFMLFNARRNRRYWAGETSKDDSLDDAVAVIPETEKAASNQPVMPAPKGQPIKKMILSDAAMHPKQNKSTVLRVGGSPYKKTAAVNTKRTMMMLTAKINVFKRMKSDAFDYAKQQRRVASFLKAYTQAYEQKDLDRFKSFFAKGALEQGKQFEEMLPTYRKTFSLVEALNYHIDMKSLTIDNMSQNICVKGAFTASYRLPKKVWGSSFGSIQLELLDTPHGFLVSRLNYQKENR